MWAQDSCIYDDNRGGSLEINGVHLNLAVSTEELFTDDVVYQENDIAIENAVVDITGPGDEEGYECGLNSTDGKITVTNSKIAAKDTYYALNTGNSGPVVINKSTVDVERSGGIMSYPGQSGDPIVIENSKVRINSKDEEALAYEGSVQVKNSEVHLLTEADIAADGWYGGISITGNSYVEMEAAEKAFELARTDECLTIDDGLEVTEGELAEDNKSAVTKRLVIASTIVEPDIDPAAQAGGAVAAVIVGTAAVGAAALAAYSTGTTIYLNANLPAGLVVPSNREGLALAVWEKAGKPEPASAELYRDIDENADDAQKASHWMVEQGLMSEDGEDTFAPLRAVSKLRVCMTWQNAKDKGLI